MGALLDARWVHGQRSAWAHLTWLAASNDVPRQRVDDVLEMVGLAEVARQNAGSFSLGMSQRLGLAVALLGDPQYLLFDEPGNGLDPEGIVWICRIMKRLAAQGRLIADTSVEAFIADSAIGSIRVRARDIGPLAEALLSAGASIERLEDGPALRVHSLNAEQIGEEAFMRRTEGALQYRGADEREVVR